MRCKYSVALKSICYFNLYILCFVMNVAESSFSRHMSLDCLQTVVVTPGMQEHSNVD